MMISRVLSFYNRKRLLFNAVLSVFQVLVMSGSYFILYSILLKTLGPVKLGVWSLILSTSSVANIANIGLTSSLVKYIAAYTNNKDAVKINNLIKTGLISIIVFIGCIALLIYIVGYFTLPYFIDSSQLTEGLFLLPLSLLSLWINGIAGVFVSAIDGFHSSSLRSIIYIISSLLFLIIAYILLPQYGLFGVAIAQITQVLSILIFSGIGLKIIFKEFSLFPFFWDKITFKQIFKYSANFQIIGLLQLFYDPTTKFLLSKYGGLNFLGFYEMSSRLIQQIRSLIVSANQVIVPTIASRTQNNGEEIQDVLYPKLLNLVVLVAFPIGVSFIVLAPYISYYWIGYYENYFISTVILLSFGYFLNTVCIPAYFSSVGTGYLKGILVAHLVMAIMNGLLGLLLGYLYGGWGVVIAFVITLLTGAAIMIITYHRNRKIQFKTMLGEDLSKIGIYSLITSIIGITLYYCKLDSMQIKYLFILRILILFIYIKFIWQNNTYCGILTNRITKGIKKYLAL